MAEKKEKKEKIVRNSMDEVKALSEITLDLIKDYVMKQGDDAMQWLVDTMTEEIDAKDKKGKPILDDDGNPTKRTRKYVEVRNAFAEKYFPQFAPKKTSPKPNKMKDTLAELQAALAKKK